MKKIKVLLGPFLIGAGILLFMVLMIYGIIDTTGDILDDISDYGISYTLGTWVRIFLVMAFAILSIKAIEKSNAGAWLSKHFSSFMLVIIGLLFLALGDIGMASIPNFISMMGVDVSSSFFRGVQRHYEFLEGYWAFILLLYMGFVLYNIIKARSNAIFHFRVFTLLYTLMSLFFSIPMLLSLCSDRADMSDKVTLMLDLFAFVVFLKLFLITYSKDTRYFFPVEKRKVGVFDIFLSTLLYSGTIYSIIYFIKL